MINKTKSFGALTIVAGGFFVATGCSGGEEVLLADEEEVDVVALGSGWHHRDEGRRDHRHGPGRHRGRGHGHGHGRDQSECTVSVTNRVLRQEVEVVERGHGPDVELVSVAELDMTTPGENVFTEKTTVGLRGGGDFLSYETTTAPGAPTRVSIAYGPLIQGANQAEFVIQDNVLTGNIDGRTFRLDPADGNPSDVVFADGGRAPRVRTRHSFLEALGRLRHEAKDAFEECALEADSLVELSPPNQDRGHFSDTYDTLECDGCKVGAVAGITLATVACCAGTFGFGCGACIAGAIVGNIGAIAGCEASGLCCPVSCGDGVGSTCCFGNEQCLNGAGVCCSQGTVTCAGLACCNGDQSCIDGGPNKGTCCQDGLLCGQNCCTEGEGCLNSGTGQCCQAGRECGSACCGRVGDHGFGYCLDANTSTCCTTLQVTCGTECCDFTEVCENGQCVSPPAGSGCETLPTSRGRDIPCNSFEDCPPNTGTRCIDTAVAPSPFTGCCIETVQ